MDKALLIVLLIASLSSCVGDQSKEQNADSQQIDVSSETSEEPRNTFSPDPEIVYSPGESTIISKTFPESKIDGYMIHLPQSFFDRVNRIPILIFLQGSGATGGAIDQVNLYGIPNYLLDIKGLNVEVSSYLLDSFIVVAPHVAVGAHVDEEAAIASIIEEVSDKYNGNSFRTYLTGLSFGGFSTWGLASKIPEKFAAVAPMAGGVWAIKDYQTMKDLPIWVGHCTGDPDMPYQQVSEAVDSLEVISGKDFLRIDNSILSEADIQLNPKIFSSFDRKSHDAWTEVYNSPSFYRWLLAQSKSGTKALVSQ